LDKSQVKEKAGQTQRILPGNDWRRVYEKKILNTNFSADKNQCKEAND
jgi:hypothetical protein